MTGIHIFKPNFSRVTLINAANLKGTTTQYFGLEDFDIVVLYLSILNWKKYNGDIHLYTNTKGKEILTLLGIIDMYDYVSTDILDNETCDYNPEVFWAACKLHVQKHLSAPYCILDMDLYVEKNLNEVGFFDKPLGIFHKETLHLSYPHPRSIPGYNIKEEYHWQHSPVNVALLYVNNNEFKNEYVDKALSFINNSPKHKLKMDDFCSARIVFAEQRILGEMIGNYGIDYSLLIKGLYTVKEYSTNCIGFNDVMNFNVAVFEERDGGEHFHSNIKEVSGWLSHLWGLKQILLNDSQVRIRFVARLILKLMRDFPSYHQKLTRSLNTLYSIHNQEYVGQTKAA